MSTSKGLMAQKRYRHMAAQEAKPLDRLAIDYEAKLKKRKRQAEPAVDTPSGKKSKLGVKRVGNSKNARNELKGTDQIRKERAVKQQRREKNARPSNKGGKKRGGRR
jgi:ATP-dependent RNA helicase DDX54/DBP10